MIALVRPWLKLFVAIALVVGCNVAAPAMSASTDAAVTATDMPCHQDQGKGDALPTLCGKACLAIPAFAPAITLVPVAPARHFGLPPSVFAGRPASPATPPPRLA